MDSHTNFIGERLKTARIYRGMSLTDLEKKMKITKQALSQYENGKIQPETANLLKLAEILRFPMEYFSTPPKISLSTGATFFRSLLRTSKIDRNAQSKRLEFVALIYSTLLQYIDFPKLNIPTFTAKLNELEKEKKNFEIEQIANDLREFWKLGDVPIEDFKYILEKNGVIVIRIDPKSNEIDAFNQKVCIDGKELFFIAIAPNQNYVRSRFDMAHELGHIILHQWIDDVEALSREEFKDMENEANIFASAFLLPKSSFGQDVRFRANNLKYYEYLKSKWNVSIQAMVMRAYSLGVISLSQYQTLWRQISFHGYKIEEPGDRPFNDDQNLLKEAIELSIAEKVITPEGLIKAFNENGIFMEIDDIEELIGLDNNTLKVLKPPTRIIKFRN